MLRENGAPAGAAVVRQGSTTISYAPVTGVPRTARLLQASGPAVLEVLTAELPGWHLLVTEDQGRHLVRAGARVHRHAATMHRDLRRDPPPPHRAHQQPPAPLRAVPCDRPATAVLPAWRAAYPPQHPDGSPSSDQQLISEELQPLLSGRVLGPLLDSSALIVNAADEVVAGIVVNDFNGTAWIGDLFRHPDPTCTGLGGLLLRRALARTAAQGWPVLGLAVTLGNPARHIYDKLGFTTVETSLKLALD
ncbi:GNAT family N-acetyltransferase [Saccharopolyspora sp. NPDC000359]|uniref:GNAT family N-acetyltransferase n=1 Tax=Saccharopolyspora sp. NPDC000359 TaxID=3154251 RepID=UPI003329931C